MAITPGLNSIEDLLGKLEREEYRAYHATNKRHKADHFFNFCITANAMKEYFFEHKSILGKARRAPYHAKWSDDPVLVAARDIANTVKHLVLREPQTNKPRGVTTKGVEQKDSRFVDIYVDVKGGFRVSGHAEASLPGA